MFHQHKLIYLFKDMIYERLTVCYKHSDCLQFNGTLYIPVCTCTVYVISYTSTFWYFFFPTLKCLLLYPGFSLVCQKHSMFCYF